MNLEDLQVVVEDHKFHHHTLIHWRDGDELRLVLVARRAIDIARPKRYKTQGERDRFIAINLELLLPLIAAKFDLGEYDIWRDGEQTFRRIIIDELPTAGTPQFSSPDTQR